MADIDTGLSSPVFAIDRAPCAASRDILVGAIKFHVAVGNDRSGRGQLPAAFHASLLRNPAR